MFFALNFSQAQLKNHILHEADPESFPFLNVYSIHGPPP